MELIDWDRVLELKEEVGDDVFAEVVELSAEELEETFQRLDAAQTVTSSDMHFLKGASLNLGFAALSDACKAGELGLKADPETQVDLVALRNLYDRSKAEMDAMAEAD